MRSLEEATRIALAHELAEVGAEQHVEDRVGLRIGEKPAATAPASTLPSGVACSATNCTSGCAAVRSF